MSRKKDLMLNTIIIAIGKISTQLISIFLLPLYTSILTVEEYGTYDLIITITVFLLPFVTMLMEESMFRFLIDAESNKEKKQIISQTCIYIVVSSILFSIVIFTIGKIFNIKDTNILIIYLIANVLVGLRNAIIRGMGKIKLYSISNFASSLMILILNVIFIAYLKLGYYGLIYSSIISNVLVTIIVFIKINVFKYISFKDLDKEKTKEMIRYSIPLVPNSISWAVINLSDRIVISSALGTAANGIYSMAYKFPNIVDTIYNFFYVAWKESAAKVLKDEDSAKFYNKVYDILKRFLYAITIGIIACLPFVFSLLIKKEFTEAYLYIPILVLAIYFSNVSGYYGGIFSAYKDTKIMGQTTIIGSIVNLVVDIALIKFIGIWAAAISTLVSTFVVYILRKKRINNIVKLNESNQISRIIIFAIVIFSYYTKKLFINIAVLIIVVIYCVYTNREVILNVINSVKKKFIKKIQ